MFEEVILMKVSGLSTTAPKPLLFVCKHQGKEKIWRTMRSLCGYSQGDLPTHEKLMGETRKVAVCKLTHGT